MAAAGPERQVAAAVRVLAVAAMGVEAVRHPRPMEEAVAAADLRAAVEEAAAHLPAGPVPAPRLAAGPAALPDPTALRMAGVAEGAVRQAGHMAEHPAARRRHSTPASASGVAEGADPSARQRRAISMVSATFQPGSAGGGGGGSGGGSCGGGGGGGGGGALRLTSPTQIVVQGTGVLRANGAVGGNGSASGGGGGGGSGGVVYLWAPTVTVSSGAVVSAVGGGGGSGTGSGEYGGPGGAGGLGRIRISATQSSCTLNAPSFNPPLFSACSPANMAGNTYVAAWPN